MRYLLDTCILSEPFKRQPNPHVIAWLRSVDQATLYTPALVLGEMSKGVAKMPASARREMLEKWLGDYRRFYSDNIVVCVNSKHICHEYVLYKFCSFNIL